MKEIFHLLETVEVARKIKALLFVLTQRSGMMAEHLERIDDNLKRGT